MADSATTAENSVVSDSDTILESPAEATGSPPERHRSRRRRSKNGRQLVKVQRSNRNLKITLAILIMALTAVVVIGKRIQSRQLNHNQQLSETIDSLRAKLEESHVLSKKLLADMDSLVESRLPGLNRLQYDTVIPVAVRYVKNVIFAISKDARVPTYEYRFVFFNPKITPVFPRVKVHLFDDRGIEVGNADVTGTGQASAGRVRSLGPGEIRSYNGSFSVIADQKPYYFLMELN